MLKLDAKTSTGRQSLILPESWKETTTDIFQRIVRDWDMVDWCSLFSIISGLPIDYIRESKDGRLESIFYRCISFVFEDKLDFASLPIPNGLKINNQVIWIPKHLGRLSIGQAIQARKSLEGVKDTRECLSIITAIYLQPIIDNAKYDHLRAIEIEQDILKMPITDIFPIGFFLLKQLKSNGNLLLHDLEQWMETIKKQLRNLLGLKN